MRIWRNFDCNICLLFISCAKYIECTEQRHRVWCWAYPAHWNIAVFVHCSWFPFRYKGQISTRWFRIISYGKECIYFSFQSARNSTERLGYSIHSLPLTLWAVRSNASSTFLRIHLNGFSDFTVFICGEQIHIKMNMLISMALKRFVFFFKCLTYFSKWF